MKLSSLLLAAGVASLWFTGAAFAQGPSKPRPVPPEPVQTPYATGAVVGQFVGRFAVAADGTGEVIGYFPVIEGLEGSLFSSAERTEKTAMFSVRSDRMTLAKIPNGAFNHFTLAPVADGPIQYRVYYHAAPNRSFALPATFSDGTLVATFNVRNGVVTVLPSHSLYSANMELASSEVFPFAAKTYDLGLFGAAVAVQITGATIPATITASGASIPLTGFLTAIGAKP